MPKGHALDHILFALRKSAVCRKRSLNPLIFSVQLFEDFIGRVSRAARKASPQQVVKSVLQRCLQASYRHWHAGGFVKDWWFQDKERGKKKNWLRDVCFKGAFEGVYIYIYIQAWLQVAKNAKNGNIVFFGEHRGFSRTYVFTVSWIWWYININTKDQIRQTWKPNS